ncbi:MAG: hypothetical protein QM729_12970 [Solirubrobacterales bacterium]
MDRRAHPVGSILRRGATLVVTAVATWMVWAAIAPPSGSAATTVVNFDDQTPGTVIGEQYASLGVHVGPSPFPEQTGGLTVVGRSQASSAPNAAALAYDPNTDFSSSWIRFDTQQRSVSFKTCRTGTGGSPTPNVNAVAYDSNGNVVANVTDVACTADGALVPVTVTAEHITYLNVYATGGGAAPGPGWILDDLTFETSPPAQSPPPPPPGPPAPTPPDFSLYRWTGPTTPEVLAVAPGATATAQIVVGRNETSDGPVALSVAGLPAGVTAGFDDPAPDGAGPRLVSMTLSAAAGAAVGDAHLTITGTPGSPAAGSVAHSIGLDIVVQGHLAAYVKGIEITQGTQTEGQPDFTTYQGARLVQGKPTVVRVYVGFMGTIGGGARPQIGLSLTAGDSTGQSTILPQWSPPADALSVNELGIGAAERVSPSQAFVFTLPDNWTRRRSLTLRATVLAPEDPSPFDKPIASGATLCLQRGCGATPTRELTGITFTPPPPAAQISAIEQDLAVDDAQGRQTGTDKPLDAATTFAQMIQVSPVPFTFLDAAGDASPIPRYRAVRTPPRTGIWEDADAFDSSIGRPGHSTYGVFNEPSGNGVTMGDGPRVSVGTSNPRSASDDRIDRPLTVIAHEMFHTFGLLHADTTVAKGGCGGGDGAFTDPTGRLGSVGIDISFLSGGSVDGPPYRMIGDTEAHPAYDFMSYCAIKGDGDPNSWVSVQNWDKVLGVAEKAADSPPAAGRAAPRTAAPTGSTLHVLATTGPGAPAIQRVDHGGVTADGSPTPYRLVGLDADGRTVASAATTGSAVEVDDQPGGPFTALEGALPAARVRTVQVVLGTTVLATRTASAHAPKATLMTPKAVGGAKTVTVRWRASDADHDPVSAELDYSTDGGRTFDEIYGAGTARVAEVPVTLLAPSTHARLRLRVSDGFNVTTVESKTFVVAPRPPTPTILMPAGRERIAAGAAIYLSGGAVDAAGRALTGRHLRWFAGKTKLGSGAKLSAILPAGTRRVRLEAVDAAGRAAWTSARVVVAPTTPFFLSLEYPHRLSRRARSVRLTVTATQPSILRIGAAQFAVGRTRRTVRVAITPGSSTLHLRLRLTAGGRSMVQPVEIARRARARAATEWRPLRRIGSRLLAATTASSH